MPSCAGLRLAAYVVLASSTSGVEAVSSVLRAHCHNRLQRAAVPAVFEILEGLPLSAAGKVERSALPLPKVWASVGPDTASSSTQQGEACIEPGSIDLSCGHLSKMALVLAQQAQTTLRAMLLADLCLRQKRSRCLVFAHPWERLCRAGKWA